MTPVVQLYWIRVALGIVVAVITALFPKESIGIIIFAIAFL